MALAVDQAGDLSSPTTVINRCSKYRRIPGTYYGTPIGAGDLQTVVGMGMYGPYLIDGLSATSVASELMTRRDWP